MVAKRAVVWVLGDGHELHGVISRLLDAWKDVIAELSVCTYALPLGCHANMCLVDKQLAHLRSAEVVMLPVVGFLNDKLRGIVLRSLILHYALCVCGYSVAPTIITMNMKFV